MNYKVSILVPLYNVSKFIEKCAVSLFEQTLQGVEFIFVNDCTPDNSIEILLQVIDKYPFLENSIKIINHETNRGLAAARNTGVKHAKGEYILHVDSDDRIEFNMAALLYSEAKKTNADIVVCDFILEWENTQKVVEQYWNSSPEIFNKMILSLQAQPAVWNKLIRRELYTSNSIEVPASTNLGEDLVTIPKLIFFSKKIVKINTPLYYYNQTNELSYTKNFSIKNLTDALNIFENLKDFFKANNKLDIYQASIDLGKVKTEIRLLLEADSKYWNEIHSKLGGIKTGDVFKSLTPKENFIFFLFSNNFFNTLKIYRNSYYRVFRVIQKFKGR